MLTKHFFNVSVINDGFAEIVGIIEGTLMKFAINIDCLVLHR